jgi:hypothetical protein
MSAGWVTGSLLPRTGDENNVRDRAAVLEDAIREIHVAARELKAEAARVYDREQQANARLADVQKLLWMWVAGDYPSGVGNVDVPNGQDADLYLAIARDGARAAIKQRIHELATILGEDLDPAEVQYQLRKRRDAERLQLEG